MGIHSCEASLVNICYVTNIWIHIREYSHFLNIRARIRKVHANILQIWMLEKIHNV